MVFSEWKFSSFLSFSEQFTHSLNLEPHESEMIILVFDNRV